MSDWLENELALRRPEGLRDWLRVLRRGGPLLLLLLICFPLLLLLRLPEGWFFGLRRPFTPYITQFVCISACCLIGLKRKVSGVPMQGRGAYVANHSSWLDIFVLNASKRIYFVAKAEVHAWAGIGWLARGTGTVFIERNRSEAKRQQEVFETRLDAGHGLMFFPEGTSTDSTRVLPFKTTLFQAFFTDHLHDTLSIQPISLHYRAPEGQDARFYGWWGGMDFVSSLLAVLSVPRHGHVEVIYHPALKVSDFENRKALAKAAETAVREGFSAELP